MRIVHTADWHLGKTLYGRERTEEEREALSYLKDFIKENNVELLIIAGDIFDKFIPPSRAEEVLFNFLVELHYLGIQVVMIAGNHDSGIRFSSISQMLKIAGIHSFGRPGPNTYVKIISKKGEPVFIAAIPFIRESEILNIEDYEVEDHISKARYAERMEAVFRYFEKMFLDDGINILATHLLVGGAAISGTEHKFYLANSYAVPALSLPHTAGYIALGHIHKYQKIDTPSPSYYSGSLFPLDFGEDDEKGFIFLDIKPGLPPDKIEFVPVPHKKLLKLQIRNDQIDNLIFKYKEFDGYLKVIIDTQGENPTGLTERIKVELPQVLSVQIAKKEGKRRDRLSQDDILDPVKSYISYCEKKKGQRPKEEVLEIFEELYKKVIEDED